MLVKVIKAKDDGTPLVRQADQDIPVGGTIDLPLNLVYEYVWEGIVEAPAGVVVPPKPGPPVSLEKQLAEANAKAKADGAAAAQQAQVAEAGKMPTAPDLDKTQEVQVVVPPEAKKP